jgi:PPP family 3-phenylpropionic acid transporter
MTESSAIPYWRLSGFYFWYFAALGAFLPYWTLYLASRGFSAVEIGQMMAVVAGTKIIAPNLWGWFADRTGTDLRLIRLAGLATVLSFGAMRWASGFWWFFWVTLSFSFFWNACLPLFEALTLRHLAGRVERYSQIRAWGSLGFIASVAILGFSLNRPLLSLDRLPLVVGVLLIMEWLASLGIPYIKSPRPQAAERFSRTVWRRDVVAFFVVVMLLQASHGPYYVFFSIYLEAHGFDAERIGLLWVLGVLAEIALFIFAHRLLRRYRLRTVLLASLLLAALRWLLIGWAVESTLLLCFAQLLHGASFGSTHAVGIQLTLQYFSGRHRNKGQALYSSASFGLGGALGSLLSGEAWTSLGPEGVFTLAAACCILAWLIGWMWVGRRSPAEGRATV